VWLDEPVARDVASDPYLFSGYRARTLHLAHDAAVPVAFTLEVDRAGDGRWTALRTVEVPAGGYAWTAFPDGERGAWVRVRAARDLAKATAFFAYRASDERAPAATEARFAGLARTGAAGTAVSGGLLHARGAGRRTLGLAAGEAFYELGPDMQLERSEEPGALEWMRTNVAIPADALAADAASLVYTDEAGRRFRLPRGRADFGATGPLGTERAVREVCTERDLLNAGGTFFELPAENAGGIAKVRPVATHLRRIHDFATWRGLLVMTGIDPAAAGANRHVIRSTDGRAAVWVGAVDDLWALGKPVGEGGPWHDTAVRAGEPSDPYLMTGYDRKSVRLSHRGSETVTVRIEVDVAGTGTWVEYRRLAVPPGQTVAHAFPADYQAYWVRVSADRPVSATARFVYE